MFLVLPDSGLDPLVRGADPAPDPDPSLFSYMCWAYWHNGSKIKVLLTENNVPLVTEERVGSGADPDPEPGQLVRGTDPGIRIRAKISRVPSTGIYAVRRSTFSSTYSTKNLKKGEWTFYLILSRPLLERLAGRTWARTRHHLHHRGRTNQPASGGTIESSSSLNKIST